VQSKNKKAMTTAEREHVNRIKEMPCGVCDARGPSEAHEIEQGQWFTSIPLCEDCHRGSFNGIHGQQRIWKVKKLTELLVLNNTVRDLYA
jgi:hypothetical protein